ncbi:MAG: hypothetical protein RL204_428 [Bacteroidota bacterium]|jgi:hypothetical protein
MNLDEFVFWDFGDHGFTALAYPKNDIQTGIKTQIFIASILGQDFKPHGARDMFAFCTIATFLRELEKRNLLEELYPWLREFVKRSFNKDYWHEILNNTPAIIAEINQRTPIHGSDYPSTILN